MVKTEDKICSTCGVILDEEIETCPLCKAGSGDDVKEGDETNPSDILRLSERRSRIYTWELSILIAVSANLICLIVDLVILKGLNWSLYAITSITGLWLFITAIIFLSKRIVLMAITLALSSVGMLVIYDLLHLPLDWFIGLGLPVAVTFWILFAIFLLITRIVKRKGFNILAILFLEIAVFCFIIEVFGDLWFSRKIYLDWSAICAATLVPLAGILLFIHHRMKRGNDLRSFFHV